MTRNEAIRQYARRSLPALTLLAAVAVAACDTATEDAAPAVEDSARTDATDGALEAADGVAAMDPWVRVAIRPQGSDAPDAPPVNTAGYVRIRNGGGAADALVGVDAGIADTVELHSVTMQDGVMRMRAVDSVAIPADGVVALEPGGYHIMFIGIREALAEGDSVPLTLRFRSGRTVEFTAPVRRQPPD